MAILLTDDGIDLTEMIDRLEINAHGPRNLYELLPRVQNNYQRDILGKLNLRHESFQMYLCNYEKNTSTERKKMGLQGTCTVLGTMKKGIRESYEIRIYKP